MPNSLVLRLAFHRAVAGIGKALPPKGHSSIDRSRNHGEPSQSEFTVVKVDAYHGINSYLLELSDTCMKSVQDIIGYNNENSGTEGAQPGDHPAFPSGQVSHFILGQSNH